MLTLYYVLCALAITVMTGAMLIALRLRRLASGGHIGSTVNVLIAFIGLFFAGYVVAPWLARFPEVANLLMAGVFVAGAVFVVLVLRLLEKLMGKVLSELRL
jgi:hypothetical protein